MSYETVMGRVASAAAGAGRATDDITVVAVSKTKGPDEILEVYEKGHRDFGENRAQELAAKAPALPDDIRWHFVGALQSNKAKVVRPITYLLQSMDRGSLAAAWLKGPGLPPPVLVQVNVGNEPQKSGIEPDELGTTLETMINIGLTVTGLMAIPPAPVEAEESRPRFRQLRRLRDHALETFPSVRELSIGMTDDFEIAIEEGASIIRVGRAIFGPRN